MDPNSGGNETQGQQPQGPAGQPQYAPQYAPPGYGRQPYGQVPYGPQGTIVPIGEGWAPGVGPMAVAPQSRRLRWGIAGAVVLCVVLVTAAGAFVLSGAGGMKSLTASAAPKNAIGFLEVRIDLPGDQRAKLADFMSHFPGFMDRAQFDTAMDELLNRLIRAASPGLQYSSALKPWMEGEVGVAVMDVGGIDASTGSSSIPTVAITPRPSEATPRPSEPGAEPTPSPTEPSFEPSLPSFEPSLPSSEPDSTTNARREIFGDARYDAITDYLAYAPPSAVAIIALKDRAAAEAWVASEVGRLGMTATSSDYAGTALHTTEVGGVEGAYAFTDKNLLLGTVGGVKAALDTKTKGSLADNATYQTAMKSVSGDSLARMYVDCRGLLAQLPGVTEAAGAYGTALPMGSVGASAMDLPPWLAGSVRAESDRMVLNVTMPRTGTLTLGNHVSRLASVLPGSTVAVIEAHSIGKQIAYQVAALEAQLPGTDGMLSEALAQIGGVDWLGDGVAVVTRNGSTYGGGLVVETTDATTAATKVASIANLATLGGASYGILSRQETYKGFDITVIGLPASLAGSLGVDLPVGDTAIEIAIAAKDNLIVAGYTDAFVKAVIDTTPSTALASQADYSKAMDAVGASNEQSFYINVPALEDEIGRLFFGSSSSLWTQYYKPYFDHLGSVAGATIDGSTVAVRLVVMAR